MPLPPPVHLDQLATGLDAAAEKRVGRTTRAQTLLLRQGQNSLPIRLVDGEGFFGVGMFPGVENLLVHAGVDLRHRQVDDDLDVGITQQLVDGAAPVDLELLGSLLREGDIETHRSPGRGSRRSGTTRDTGG